MVIVEYCKFGNIQHILRKHRRTFVDQINRDADVIDPNMRNKTVAIEVTNESEGSADEDDEQIANHYTDLSEGKLKIIFIHSYNSDGNFCDFVFT